MWSPIYIVSVMFKHGVNVLSLTFCCQYSLYVIEFLLVMLNILTNFFVVIIAAQFCYPGN